jgi:eukaryotic-like serine/threonine-protein kinase
VIGETVGNFTIVERLGKGGMGEVWLAEHKTIKTKVAIKVLLPDVSADRNHIERFFNEAVAVSKIKHAGIAKIFDVGFHNEKAYLVMEFLDGEPLSARIRRLGRLPITDVAEIGRQIASVLEATHSEGITHRDLKPDNIYLVRDKEMDGGERVKVLDFGIAKLGTQSGLTGTSGGSMGTPGYMSPEQWKHSAKVDGRADSYSLGCVTFEMATGRPPFMASSIGEACGMHLNDVPPLARSIVASVPAALDTLIQQLLAKNPEDRPAIEDVKTKLAAIAESPVDTLAATMTPATAPTSKIVAPDAVTRLESDTTLGASAATVAHVAPPAKRSKALLVGAGAVFVVGGFAVFAMSGGGKSEPAANPPPDPRPPTVDAAMKAAIDAAVVDHKGWVRIDPPKKPIELGLAVEKAPEDVRGFRRGRGVMSPKRAYWIQAHEVTWGDIETWLVDNPAEMPTPVPSWAVDVKVRARLPVSGLTWTAAGAYCRSIDARLPTEEEWEFAARGAELRPHPWGDQPIDAFQTRVYGGEKAVPNQVGTNDQDRTPDGKLFDMAGNVQEWTAPVYRADIAGTDESWVIENKTLTSFRTIRGLPLGLPTPEKLPTDSGAYRHEFCSTGVCIGKSRKRLAYIGFRCARSD